MLHAQPLELHTRSLDKEKEFAAGQVILLVKPFVAHLVPMKLERLVNVAHPDQHSTLTETVSLLPTLPTLHTESVDQSLSSSVPMHQCISE